MSTPNDLLRALPAVDTLLNSDTGAALAGQYGRQPALDAIRGVLDDTRARLRAGDVVPSDGESLLAQAAERLHRAFLPSLRPVINATGVIIHTNLGRAPLSEVVQSGTDVASPVPPSRELRRASRDVRRTMLRDNWPRRRWFSQPSTTGDARGWPGVSDLAGAIMPPGESGHQRWPKTSGSA